MRENAFVRCKRGGFNTCAYKYTEYFTGETGDDSTVALVGLTTMGVNKNQTMSDVEHHIIIKIGGVTTNSN